MTLLRTLATALFVCAAASHSARADNVATPVGVPVNAIVFKVPYSFESVPAGMKTAELTCWLLKTPVFPDQLPNFGVPNTSLTIDVSAGTASGTATIVVDKTVNEISPANARSYQCGMRWMHDSAGQFCSIAAGEKCGAQPTSVLKVKGKIE